MAGNAYLRAFGKHWMKPLTLAALIAPFAFLAWQFYQVLTDPLSDAMGTDPVAYIHHFLGDTAIRILLITLAISPIRDITGWAPIALIRRRVGLAAFFYAALHMLAYLWLDKDWSLSALWEDMVIRTYIMLGMAALVLMIPLAVTSNNTMIRRLGRQTWDRLHWLIYPLAILAVAHNLLMVKIIYGDPLIHAVILVLLLGWRVGRWGMGKLRAPAAT
jgi:sulfoxide reductase heme-binding subunit YedZ